MQGSGRQSSVKSEGTSANGIGSRQYLQFTEMNSGTPLLYSRRFAASTSAYARHSQLFEIRRFHSLTPTDGPSEWRLKDGAERPAVGFNATLKRLLSVV